MSVNQDRQFLRGFATLVIGLAVAGAAATQQARAQAEEQDLSTLLAPVGKVNIQAKPPEAAAAPAAAEAPAAAAPAAEAPAAAAPAAAAPAAEAPAAAAPAPAPAAAAGDTVAAGKGIYDQACMACHTAGAAGAPRLGDKAAWEPRIAQGADVLYKHAIEGFMGKAGMMPPKGGRPDLSDDDVKAAVDYMVSAAQ